MTHRLARSLVDTFGGRPTCSSSPQGRFQAGAARIDGRVLTDAESVGKHLLVHFDDDVVHVHLGMAGKTQLHRAPSGSEAAVVEDLGEEISTSADTADLQGRPVTGMIRWRIENEDAWLDLRGPAVCELIGPDEVEAIRRRIGPDPLRPDADPELAWQRVRRSWQPIAALLMDQKVFGGVGNIFRAESLYRARLDPMLPGVALQRREFDALWADLIELMEYAVEHGRIDTVRPEDDPEVTGRLPRQDRHGGEVYVYRRSGQPCHVCGTMVRTKVLAARNLFWCPRCQPLSRRAAAVQARRQARGGARG